MHVDIEALSGIFGSISIACWVVVFSPQIIENFRRSSAEGLSIVFIVVWLAGDIFNIVGAVLQGLLPTMIILAVYYTLADIVLILQCFYYRGFTLKDTIPGPTPAASGTQEPPTERSALLSHPTNGPASPDPSRNQNPLAQTTSRRSSFRDQFNALDGTHLSPATPLHPKSRDTAALKAQSPVQKRRPLIKSILFNSTAVLVVCAAGVLGWWLSTRVPHESHHHGRDTPAHSFLNFLGHRKDENEKGGRQRRELHFNILGQVFGYICAILYLGSRIPQLILNYRRKSTEGVSMLFFLFACIGNLAYVLSILAYEPACYRAERLGPQSYGVAEVGIFRSHGSCEPGEAKRLYIRNFLVNFSWLLGSFGTLLQDATVFLQWYWYRDSQAGEVQGGDQGAGNDVAVDGAHDIRS